MEAMLERAEEDHGRREVKIKVDGKLVEVHRGRMTVAEIKAEGKVPPAFDLDQVIDGKLTPLPDDGSVVLKGGEVFVSHPKSAHSS